MKHAYIAHIHFLDHSSFEGGNPEPLECDAVGVLYKEDSRAYYLATFISERQIDPVNTSTIVVLKKAVIKLTKLKRFELLGG